MFASLPSAVRSYLRLDAPPDVSALLDARDVARILNAFASPAEVFSLLTVTDVRRALVRAPARVHLLVRLLVAHLESLRDDPAFCPRPRQAGAGGSGRLPGLGGAWSLGLQSSAAREDTDSARDRHREALNCIRILTRILPVIMEGDHDATCLAQSDASADAERPEPDSPSAALASSNFERSLFLCRLPAPESADLVLEPRGADEPLTALEASQFVIDEDETEDEGGAPSPGDASRLPAQAEGPADGSEPPLIERLVSLVVDLLFYSGFTLPWTSELLALPDSVPARDSHVHYAIWEQGVGSSIELKGTSRAHEAARVETLRLLLVLLSKAIYVPATEQSTHKDAALSFAAASLDRSVALPLLCSLLNTGVKHAGDSHWLASLAGLPGGLVKDRLAGTPTPEETRSTLAGLCLQTLGVLLAWEPVAEAAEAGRPSDPHRPPLASTASSASLQSNARAEPNAFRFYLSKLHRHADFVLLSTALLDAAAVRGSGSLNPLAQRAAPTLITGGGAGGSSLAHAPEALLLFWRLLTHNARFRVFMLDDEVRAPLLLSCLLSHALTHKDSVAQQGLVRLCIFMLQDVSATSAFALRICARGSAAHCRIPNASRWGIVSGTAGQPGTAADALIQAAYAVMASTRGALSALYPPLVIALANTAPSWRGLTVASSARLASLLASFSAPAFLLADEGNPRLLFFLLEALNAVLHRNAQANPNLLYALLRSRRDVERLSRFTLASGIADVRRSRQRTGHAAQVAQAPRRPSQTGDAPALAQTSPTPLDTALAEDEKTQEQAPVSAADAESAALTDSSSEKVRGKRRQMSGPTSQAAPGAPSPDALDAEDALVAGFSDDELLAAASTIGRNGFIATPGWVASWQSGLPLDTLQVVLMELVPRVEEHCAATGIIGKSDADERILAFLREQTLRDVLPAAPAMHLRAFRWNEQARVWLLSYLWGLVYVSAQLPHGIYAGSTARLFQLRSPTVRSSSTPDLAVPGLGVLSDAVAGVLGVFGRGGPTSPTPSAPATPQRVGSHRSGTQTPTGFQLEERARSDDQAS